MKMNYSDSDDDDENKMSNQAAFIRQAESEINLGLYEAGIKSYQEALRIMQSRLGPRSLPVLHLKCKMANILSDQTRMPAAEGLFKEIMESTYVLLIQSDMITEGDEFTSLLKESIIWLEKRAINYYHRGKYERADKLFRESYDKVRSGFGIIDQLSKKLKGNLEKNELELAKTRKEASQNNSKSISGNLPRDLNPRLELQTYEIGSSSSKNTDVSTDNIAHAALQANIARDIPLETDGEWGFDDNLLFDVKETTAMSADSWFSFYLEHHTQALLKPYRPNDSDEKQKRYHRVKIAIIDSGIDPTHGDVKKCLGRIAGYRSWIPNEPGWSDDSGHGTHVAMSLLRVAPEADIYVARVFSRTFLSPSSVIGPAITHAVESWNVDIISMSFGSSVIDQDIFDAISFAAYKNVLMFAAATNKGKNERIPRAYPARDWRIFSISAADGLGTPSKFNPAPQEGDLNFCILGESVNSATIKGKTVRKSGTSMATPIAAGVAALIIEFAKQTRVEGEEEVENPDLIKTYQGMRNILKAMSDVADGHRYLAPWKILSVQLHLYDMLKARGEAARIISRLLKDR